jgi:hypothetical protein
MIIFRGMNNPLETDVRRRQKAAAREIPFGIGVEEPSALIVHLARVPSGDKEGQRELPRTIIGANMTLVPFGCPRAPFLADPDDNRDIHVPCA